MKEKCTQKKKEINDLKVKVAMFINQKPESEEKT